MSGKWKTIQTHETKPWILQVRETRRGPQFRSLVDGVVVGRNFLASEIPEIERQLEKRQKAREETP